MTSAEQGLLPAWAYAPTIVLPVSQIRGCDGRPRTSVQPFTDRGDVPAWATARTVIIPRSELGLYHRKIRGDYASELTLLDTHLAALGVPGGAYAVPVAPPRRWLAILRILLACLHRTIQPAEENNR